MSLNSPSSSIQKLNSDVLLYIITLNADMFSDPTALSTTRTASHVCQNWRNLMLNTPSLWARLIDLNDITPRNYEWLNELLRRSGTVSLWIRGDHIQIGQLDVDPSPDIIPRQAFFHITRENWHRIVKLVVCLQADREFSPHSPHHWAALHIPAPELDTFDVTFKWTSFTHRPDVPITTIFAGHAPKLRYFSLETFTVDERAPWLCQLRTMLFHQRYTIGHALSVLFPMRKRQRVKFKQFYNGDADTLPKIVPLPELEYFEYGGCPTLGAALLDYIEIPTNCSLYLPTTGILNGKEQDYLYVINTYTRHARRFLQGNPPQVICIDLGTKPHISLKAGDPFPDKLPLNITIPLHNMDSFTVVLDLLALQELSSAVELRISTELEVPLDLRATVFFDCLTSLETIYADVYSLIYLGNLQNASYMEKKRTLFPFLKVVNLGVDQCGNYGAECYPVVRTALDIHMHFMDKPFLPPFLDIFSQKFTYTSVIYLPMYMLKE